MPIFVSERPLTAEEAETLRSYREPVVWPIWLAKAALFSLLGTGCCTGGLLSFILGIDSVIEGARSSFRVFAGIVIVIAGGFFIWAAVSEVRVRKQRRERRQAAAATGTVEVTEVVFERMWKVKPNPTRDKDDRPSVVLESRPHFLLTSAEPVDEDEHEDEAASMQHPHYPPVRIDGTFPRDRVIIEQVRSADNEVFTLAIRWVGQRMTPSGEVEHDAVPWGSQGCSSLATLASVAGLLARGPWMQEQMSVPPSDPTEQSDHP